MNRGHLLRGALLVLVLTAPIAARAQERFGAVAGTWEACNQGVENLRRQISQARPKTSEGWIRYLEQRLAVELDKCARLADAPVLALMDVINRYEQLKLDERALALALETASRFGETTDLDLVIGRLYYKRGLRSTGLTYLAKVVEAEPSNVAANQLLGAYYYDAGDMPRAITHLRVVADQLTDQFSPNAAVGDACLKVRDLPCAGRYLQRASALRPSDVLLAIRVGDLERARGELGGAIEAYERALTADAKRMPAYLGLGQAFIAAEQLENAQAALVKAADLAPAEAAPAVAAASALRRLGRSSFGVTLTQRALDAGAKTAALHVEHALSLAGNGAPQRGLEFLNGVPADMAKDDRIIAATGDLLLATGSTDRALAKFKTALASRPRAPEYLVRQARALRRLEQLDDAVAALRPHVEEENKALIDELVSCLLDRARTRAQRGEMDSARDDLRAAERLAPADEDVLLSIAAVEASSNHLDAAARALKDVAPSPQRTAAEAWVALLAKKSDEAAALADAAYRQAPKPETILVRTAALVGAGKPLMAVNELDGLDNLNGLQRQWLAQALGDAIMVELKRGNYGEARTLSRKVAGSKLPQEFVSWSARIPLVDMFKAGLVDRQSNELRSYAAARSPKPDDLDGVLGILQALLDGEYEQALTRFKKGVQGTQEGLRQRVLLEFAAAEFQAGRRAKAAGIATQVHDTNALPPELRFNLAVIQTGGKTERLRSALAEFDRFNIPAALFDKAMLLDQAGPNGAQTIDLLSSVAALPENSSVVERARALLALKKRLY
jgi:tetratricopeptide (TPR) repeat protein